MKQIFAKKSLKVLLDEMAGENRLRRVLGPVTLTALGIGAVIGAGIFVATGEAAHHTAGPALMLSYVVAGVTCIFAALCYAEFASMAPVAGSAYTYAYCTMGELFAWIIGWDLVLEYAVGAATVANGWSSYFQKVIAKLGMIVPMAFCAAPVTYEEGTFRQNVFAEYRDTVKDENGNEKTVTFRVKHKFVEEDADGSKLDKRELHWVRVLVDGKTSDEKSIGKVGDRATESKTAFSVQPAL